MEGGEELGGVKEGETIVKIYYEREENYFQ